MEKQKLKSFSKLLLITFLGIISVGLRIMPASFTNTLDMEDFGLGALPLSFIPNHGQSDESVLYQVRGLHGDIYFKSQNVLLALPNSNDDYFSVLQLEFLGRNPNSQIEHLESLPGKVNYFRGNDSSRWFSNIPSYSGISYTNLYDGIDLSYFGTDGLLKSEFSVAVGANPQLIRWQYRGAEAVWVDSKTGDLLIRLESSDILREKSPIAWQDIAGERIAVSLAFQVDEQQVVSFVIGDYNPGYSLTLDPVVEYSSYIGGSNEESAGGIASDNDGNVYVAGRTLSTNFPASDGALDETHNGTNDVYVVKINTDESGAASLVWATYLGGGASDDATDLAVDDSGNVYITGLTYSSGTVPPAFPTTGNAYSTTYVFNSVFLSKISSDGTTLLYSSFIGRGDAYALDVDSSGNAYITGTTSVLSYPTTSNAYQQTGDSVNTNSQIFLSKIDTTASGTASLVYSSYLYGNDTDFANDIAVDDAGNAYITGKTESTNFPVTASAFQGSLKDHVQGGIDAFVTRIDTTQSGSSSLAYSTYFGGQFNSEGLSGAENFNTDSGSIATSGTGIVYVTGETNSVDLPVTNAYQSTYRGGLMDAFVARFDTNQSGSASLDFSSYLGGSDYDKGYGLTADTFGNVYVVGSTQSTNFPKLNGLSYTTGGFISRINTNASGNAALLSSTRLGGYGPFLYAAFVDGNGTVYLLSGATDNTPPVLGGFQTSFGGGVDAYVTRISYYSDLVLNRSEPNNPVAINTAFSYTFTVTNTGTDTATNVTLDETLAGTLTINSATASQGSCTLDTQSYSCNLGNLTVNGSATVTVNVTPGDIGNIEKDALVNAVEIDTNITNNISSTDTSVVYATDLGVSISDTPDPLVATEELTYTATVSNNGSYDATNVILTDIFPTGLNYVSSSPSQGSCNLLGSTLSCDLGTILVGNSATVDIVVTRATSGTATNTVSVDSTEIDPVAGNNSATASTTVLPPPPAAPTLLSPANGATVNNLRPAFSWNRPTSAVRFEIQIDTSLSFTNPANSTTGTSFTPFGSLLTTSYYWRVRAFNSYDVPSEWSTVNSVIIASPLNSAPLLNFYTTSTPTLTWNSVSWASQYEIQVDDNSSFTAPLEFTTIVSATELSVTTTTLPEGTHYWRVRALNGATVGAWTTAQSFMVDEP